MSVYVGITSGIINQRRRSILLLSAFCFALTSRNQTTVYHHYYRETNAVSIQHFALMAITLYFRILFSTVNAALPNENRLRISALHELESYILEATSQTPILFPLYQHIGLIKICLSLQRIHHIGFLRV